MSRLSRWPADFARRATFFFMLLVVGLLRPGLGPVPAAGAAGTLCGIVRDGQTLVGVPRAGLFLRTPAGVYTGLNSATDASGHFCFSAIPAATYDIEVRVDDYRTAYLRNVVVVDAVSGVEIGLEPAPAGLAPPTPNPATARVEFSFHLNQPGQVRLLVCDVRGRLVTGWQTTEASAGDRRIAWDFRDREGRSVAPGRYFVKLETDGYSVTRSLIHLPG